MTAQKINSGTMACYFNIIFCLTCKFAAHIFNALSLHKLVKKLRVKVFSRRIHLGRM